MSEEQTAREREIEAEIRTLRDESDAIERSRRVAKLPAEVNRFYRNERRSYDHHSYIGFEVFQQYRRVDRIETGESGSPRLALEGYELSAGEVRLLETDYEWHPVSGKIDMHEITADEYRAAFFGALSSLKLP